MMNMNSVTSGRQIREHIAAKFVLVFVDFVTDCFMYPSSYLLCSCKDIVIQDYE
jgi:hypothetical protein